MARCSSSMRAALRYCRIVDTPPPSRMSPPSAASLACSQRGVNAVGDEPKHRAALHLERRSRVMGQHEDGRVIRRLVTPPAFPAVVGPRAPDGTEHVSTENPGADSGETLAPRYRHLRLFRRLRSRASAARCACGRTSRTMPGRRLPADSADPGSDRRRTRRSRSRSYGREVSTRRSFRAEQALLLDGTFRPKPQAGGHCGRQA